MYLCTYCALQTSTGEDLYKQHPPNQSVFIGLSVSELHSVHSSVWYKMPEIADGFYLTHQFCVFNFNFLGLHTRCSSSRLNARYDLPLPAHYTVRLFPDIEATL